MVVGVNLARQNLVLCATCCIISVLTQWGATLVINLKGGATPKPSAKLLRSNHGSILLESDGVRPWDRHVRPVRDQSPERQMCCQFSQHTAAAAASARRARRTSRFPCRAWYLAMTWLGCGFGFGLGLGIE